MRMIRDIPRPQTSTASQQPNPAWHRTGYVPSAARRVFVRGFAEGGESGKVGSKIRVFYKSLVPYEQEPDRPENLFKSVKDIWHGPDQTVGPNPVQEFVLECYTEIAKEEQQPTAAPRSKGHRQPGPSAKPGDKSGTD